MPGKTKKFIDKKHAVKFHVVHRSQRDPLQADEDAPQRVLLPQDKDKEARKEEERKFGVFYDDDYDYLKHLKDTDELDDEQQDDSESWTLERTPEVESRVRQPEPIKQEEHDAKLKLSSRMFASTVETDVGLLNKAAPISGPKLDWDPDVVAGLDEDFDFDDPDNALEDNFMEFANATEGKDSDGEKDDEDEDEYNSDTMTGSLDGGSMGGDLHMQEETKSRFTSYSMTSSVIRRNDGLTLLDDRFEQLYVDYGDDNVGALDEDEITGGVDVNSELVNQLAEEFTIQTANKPTFKQALDGAEENTVVTQDDISDDSSDDDDRIDQEFITIEPAEKWDCESILSTYSNIYNRPQLIVEEKKGRKKKQDQQQDDEEEEMEEDVRIVDPTRNYRPKDETPEEKQQRKKAVREERQARREEKKSNKIAFKKEQKRQEKEHLNLKKMQNMKLS